ncbi:MAG TPA: DNA polymerase III subunit chi [Gammaproteobacteria bacterium]|nr:DNA polymerase III subunit chi [Gammaproteobacteria bacterium]
MTRVDFHVLPIDGKIGHERWACKLAAKAWKQGHRIHVHTGGEAEMMRMDELLWTFRDISFLPHAPLGDPTAGGVAITLGHGDLPPESNEVLVNLAHPVPSFFSRFERVIEIVPAEAEARANARERYRFYQERGYPLQNHDIRGDD